MSEENEVVEQGLKSAEADAVNAKVSYSTKETKEVLRLVFTFAKTVKEAKENDGVISSADLMLLTKMLPYVGPAFDNAGDIIKELKDLDAAELKDLIVFTGANLGDLGAVKEEVLQKALNAAIALVEFISLVAKKN